MSMINISAIGASTMVGLLMAFHGVAQAADLPKAVKLTDAELDKIAAGIFVTVHGDGSAAGMLSRSEADVVAIASSGGQSDGSASGRVTAIAISTAGPAATASSTLSLSFSSR